MTVLVGNHDFLTGCKLNGDSVLNAEFCLEYVEISTNGGILIRMVKRPGSKLILLAILMMAIGFSLVARGAQPVTISFMNWDPELVAQYIKDWDKLDTGIKVTSVPHDIGKLKAMIAAGNPPDMAMLGIPDA